jgi:hypothetical protein
MTSIAPGSCFRLAAPAFADVMPALSGFVRDFPWNFSSSRMSAGSGPDIDDLLSESRRQQLVRDHTDVPVAVVKQNIRLPTGFGGPVVSGISGHLVRTGVCSSAVLSGAMIYPPGGWMGWHTNSNSSGWRLYVNYVAAGNRSFFRWAQAGTLATDYDAAGFNFRMFRIDSGDQLFWHCIYAGEWRLSLGFRLSGVVVRPATIEEGQQWDRSTSR